MKKRITLINAITSLLLQIVSIASGFIVPKLILSSFGSETNGLVSSLNQFLNYVALLEGGVNGVIMASLYGPLHKKDYEKVGSIVKTSTNFFRKISAIFIIYALGLAFIYPLIFNNSGFSYGFVCTLTLILSIKLFSQYCFALSYKNLINADKKVYYISITQIILIILDTTSAVVVTKFFPNIHLLKIISAIIFLVQPVLYSAFVKKHYKLDKNSKVDNKLLTSRWDGFAINLAFFIHNNTDITIITIIRGLSEASVYSVYALVVNGLKQVVNSVWTGLSPSLGKLYASGDKEELNKKFDILEYATFLMVFFVFTVGALLITPFVQLYTQNINDADYFQPLFGVLILIAEAIYLIRNPYVNLAYSASKFKDITPHAIIEAVLNIVFSLIFVPFMGLPGLAIGTIIGMSYRTIYQVVYLRKKILFRPFSKFARRIMIFIIPTVIAYLGCMQFLGANDISIMGFIKYGAIYSILFGALYAVISVVFFKKELKGLKGYIFKK